MTQHFFLARKLVIGSQLCIQQAVNFNEAQGISWMSPDPLRTGRVWGRDYADCTVESVRRVNLIHLS